MGEIRAWKLFCLLPSCFSDGVAETSECRKQNCVTGSTCLAWESEAIASTPAVPLQVHGTSSSDSMETESECGAFEGSDGRGRTGPTMFDGGNHCSRDGPHSARDAVTKTTRSCPEHHTEDRVAARSPRRDGSESFRPQSEERAQGSSPGPGGCTFEHLRCLVDETETNDAVCSYARASLPVEISTVLMSARLTALNKPDGGVRGIATGCSPPQWLRGLWPNSSVFSAFEAECAPFQCAPCVLQQTMIPRPRFLSVDGIGAHDHILRSAMLERVTTMREVSAILPSSGCHTGPLQGTVGGTRKVRGAQ